MLNLVRGGVIEIDPLRVKEVLLVIPVRDLVLHPNPKINTQEYTPEQKSYQVPTQKNGSYPPGNPSHLNSCETKPHLRLRGGRTRVIDGCIRVLTTTLPVLVLDMGEEEG